MVIRNDGDRRTGVEAIDATAPELPALTKEFVHGDTRRAWSNPFLQYAYAIVDHPAYSGMPCTVDEEGKVDWTIPSNRSKGSKNWDGNARRRKWWRKRATELGIPVEGHWLSQTAKSIHPWGWKPCQPCGRWMRIAYAYPNKRTLVEINNRLALTDQVDGTDYLDIYELVDHMADCLGLSATATALDEVFPEAQPIPSESRAAIKIDIHDALVANESRKLSPGAMSNAPDRLDGFHTYNLCCRSKEDTGRLTENLKTYSVDRRAFEHWAEGDWEAASVLMTSVGSGTCPRCGRVGPLTADHVGPISLGFCHTPHFEAVCGSCNSAKNNRMGLSDVLWLKELEERGEQVASWQAVPLWNRMKDGIEDDTQALRASKLLNVNQHEFFRVLIRMRVAEVPDAMMQFLNPGFAEQRVTFVELDPVTLAYSDIRRVPRQSTFALSKSTRMIRIAFESLNDYATKENRNVSSVPQEVIQKQSEELDEAIERAQSDESSWRTPLASALDPSTPIALREAQISELISHGQYEPERAFNYVRRAFENYMMQVAETLAPRLHDDDAIKEWPTSG